jgi:hypothetical protein
MARATPEQPNRVHHVFTLGAKLVTAAAALATVLGYVHSAGFDGSATRRTVGTFGAQWVGISPPLDSMWAIGDTAHLAATVTDRHGTALVGATISWSSTDSAVVAVVDGLVVARAPGRATIVAAVGDLLARAVIVVHPRFAAVHLASDSAITVAEGDTRSVSVRGTDARGHVLGLGDQHVVWRSGDTLVVIVDTGGHVTGVTAGRTTVSASLAGVSAQLPVTVVPVPGTLSVLTGGGQDAPAGTMLPAPVVVRLTSRRGRPLSGVSVRFRRVDAGGALDVSPVTTDPEGKARTAWRLGDFPGRQRLIASVDGLDSTASLDADAEPVAANTRITLLHDVQHAPIATALPERVAVRLTDSTGRPLADVPVRWETLDSGTVTATAPHSDSLGTVDANWVLGPVAGRQRLRISVGNGRLVKPAVLHAVAAAGPAAAVRVVAGNGQRAAAATPLPKSIVLRVADIAGNPVPGVRMALTPSGGTVPDSAPVTDSAGLVRARWTLPAGAHAGVYHLAARVDGIVQPADASATVIPAPAARPAAAHRRRHS